MNGQTGVAVREADCSLVLGIDVLGINENQGHMRKLIDGIHRFRSGVFRGKKELFERLSKGQEPDALFVTCSDSRVSPTLLTQTVPGDLFILRNAGNLSGLSKNAGMNAEQQR